MNDFKKENRKNRRYRCNKIIDKFKEFIENKCQWCQKEYLELQFHHVSRESKLDTINRIKRTGQRRRLIIEMKKCVALCQNCHRYADNGAIEKECFNNMLVKNNKFLERFHK